MLKKLEKIFKALGDKNRLRIINILSQRSLCVCEINSILPLSQSTISGHLRVLKDAELVEDEKNGFWVEYSLNHNHPLIAEILEIVESILLKDQLLSKDREMSLKVDRMQICKK